MELTQKHLKSILNYDKNTGIFTWIKARGRINIGDVAGSKHSAGYLRIYISILSVPKLYFSHRLAWLHQYGEWPKEQIDHINHNRADNRIENLREASYCQNTRNKSKDKRNTSGITGVGWNKQVKKWYSQIKVKGKQIHLGLFTDKNEAICARLHANRLYQFHKNHGKS